MTKNKALILVFHASGGIFDSNLKGIKVALDLEHFFEHSKKPSKE